ncbi:hypothetical protein [Polynucleobacter asymbioticus]|jgi:AcrR family transcriptional regulator|uniref:Uncharacterized protein n=1 Tax=Polynucleobacter asymbioticus TaxID=576611 RepID=A0AAC9IX92_9BURK|nr:hypothetical protein [Polynucleobacter asymbioticus]APB98607.1 hypothetical protein A4F89_04240 [Polynucleobacter asymbioticus]APC00893.1 hypothetical protein AOC25_04245 [Polynucleobacter asymbioticus]
MNRKPEIAFTESQQDRSKKTLADLQEAAYEIVRQADPKIFTSRALAKKSGYSLGTLTRRLSSIENIFFWAIERGRESKFLEMAENISTFDPNLSVHHFVETFVDKAFASIGEVNPRVMQFYEERFTKTHGLTADYYDYVDVVNEPYLLACQRNQTNTFRELSKNEARFIFKAALTLIERPFTSGDPLAGTEEHRQIAINALTGLLAK